MEEGRIKKEELRSAEIKPVFQVGETVYSALASDQRGMVTGIVLRRASIVYLVSWAARCGEEETPHDEMKLSREPLFYTPTR